MGDGKGTHPAKGRRIDRYEIRELLGRWSGVEFRLKPIEAGVGRLTTLRKQYGPERQDR